MTRSLVTPQSHEEGMDLYSIRDFGLEGQGWSETEVPFGRLPSKAKESVSEQVWLYSRHSCGLCARFVTDAKVIEARWGITDLEQSTHMSPTGIRGIDLYAKSGGQWRYVNTGCASDSTVNSSTLLRGALPMTREYLLYLPLFNPLRYLTICVNAGSHVYRAHPYPEGHEKPICFYGTSFTQGACASRPGMSYTAILGRLLHRPVINLGFSGNGRLDLVMADLLGDLDCSVFVLDCTANMNERLVRERTKPFIMKLREHRPLTPIIAMGSPRFQNAWIFPLVHRKYQSRNEALCREIDELTKQGVVHLTYIDGDAITPTNDEAGMRNHATDFAFMWYATVLLPHFEKVLGS